MTHRDMTSMTTDQAISAQPVLLSDDALDQVHGGAQSPFAGIESMIDNIKRGIGNGATYVDYHHESKTVGGNTTTVTQSRFRRR